MRNFFEARVAGERDGAIALEIAGLGPIEIPREQAPGGVNGASASVGIRPEMLTILPEETDRAEHEVTGEVIESEYYGDMTYYLVRLPGAEKPPCLDAQHRRAQKGGRSMAARPA